MFSSLGAPAGRRRRAIVLAVVLFVSFGYFHEGGGWNQNTRFDLIRAILETGSVRIDLYHENTGDKAHVGTHFYMDKAPGASLTALPAVAIARGVMRAAHRRLYSRETIVGYYYVATLAAAAAPAALAGICVFYLALWFGADDAGATIAALVCGLGTPLWAYATILYGHALAAGCLVAAFLGAVWLGDAAGRRHAAAVAWLTGLAAGWAVVTEYPASIPAGVIVLYAAWVQWQRDRRRFLPICLALGAGLAVGAVALLAYDQIAFGKALYIGYTSEEGYEGMHTGIFGVNLPSLSTARALLFGAYRGLLPLAPVLALTPVGYAFLVRDPRTRTAALVGGFVAVYYFMLTAGYVYWSGGYSYGSRHLGPALPFMCLGLAPVWMRSGKWLRGGILALALVGAGESLVAVTTTPQPPNYVDRPMADLLWPAFRSGDFPVYWQSVLEYRPPPGSMSELERAGIPRASWNLGQLAGLNGFVSLVPLALVWLLGGLAWAGTGRRLLRHQGR